MGERWTKEKYAEYLQSDHWKTVRERYRQSRLSQECYVCGHAKYELHHRTYRSLGEEKLTELLPLCRVCHEATHRLLQDGVVPGPGSRKMTAKLSLWTAAKMVKRQQRLDARRQARQAA